MQWREKTAWCEVTFPEDDAAEIAPLLDEADCSGMQTVRAPLTDSFDALEESVFLMHVAVNPGVVQ